MKQLVRFGGLAVKSGVHDVDNSKTASSGAHTQFTFFRDLCFLGPPLTPSGVLLAYANAERMGILRTKRDGKDS